MSGDTLSFDPALEQALADDPVPALPDGFADRVVAATTARAAPLPDPRPAPARRWRTARRLAFGAAGAVALGTAAAATGLLDNLPVEIPSVRQVWSNLTGSEEEPVTPARAAAPEEAPEAEVPITIEGPIDTPEELEEAFRRIDERRETRRDNRREAVDRRIDRRIDRVTERRAARGLPPPTPEEVQRVRDRVDQVRELSDERTATRIEERREVLREEVENGGEITREDFIERQRDMGSDTPFADRFERLRQLPPEERRERIRQWRERRQERLQREQGAPEVEESPETASDMEAPPEISD